MSLPPFFVQVKADWVDYNHHLNEGFYGVIFSNASDHVLDKLGLGSAYRVREKASFYTVETHTRYLAEVAEGSEVEVSSLILGRDHKRLHLWHEMRRRGELGLVASQEALLVHVDARTGKVSPSSPLADIATSTERPDAAGRGIRALG